MAQNNLSVPSSQTNAQTEKQSSPIVSPPEQDLYKLLYENSSDSNAKIIATIQWSVGIISTFVIVLLGSQILFNYRVNKEEIRAIRSELDEKFSELKANTLSNSNEERKELIEKFENKISHMEKEIKDSISLHYKERDKYIDVKLESFDKDTARLKSKLESEFSYLKIDLSKLAGDVWKLKGVNSNALKYFIDTTNLEIDKNIPIKHSLDSIIESLQNMTSISKDDQEELINMLNRVPEKYNSKKLQINELYKSLPQYIYVDDPKRPGYLKTVDI